MLLGWLWFGVIYLNSYSAISQVVLGILAIFLYVIDWTLVFLHVRYSGSLITLSFFRPEVQTIRGFLAILFLARCSRPY